MKKKYTLIFSKNFIRKSQKFIKQRRIKEDFLADVLFSLSEDPFKDSFKTHKVDARLATNSYSSRLTGDLRIVWNFAANKIKILLIDIGGHSGSKGVYK